MDFHMCSRKRPLLDGYEKQPPHYTKKCLVGLKTLLDKYQNERATQQAQLNCGQPFVWEACANGRTSHQSEASCLSEQTSSWADTQNSVKKVVEHLRLQKATSDFSLNDSVNDKFLKFHRDITEECGAEDKQHSWAVIEKQEEIIMYGPYYPNYNKGDHSEDIIIKQTEELLQTEGVSEDCKVYVFTMNSPCLARNTDPCMLNLVHKAQEWWSLYGVKTHIGYMRCWGFKGTKENLFKDINYRQMELVNQSVDHESYVIAAEKSTDLNPLCETVFFVIKRLLRSGQVNFPLVTTVQRQERKSSFKCMNTVFECKTEDERKILTQEVNTVIEVAEALLPGKTASLEEYLQRGRALALDYTFSSQICDVPQEQMRLVFQQCWRELVEGKYAEFIKEKLTEDFNQCTVQLFIKEILQVTEEYLQIGKLQFSEEDSRAVR